MTDFRKSSSGLPHTASSGTRLLSRRRPRFAVRPLALALAGGSLLSLLPGMTPNVQAQAVPGLPSGLTVVQGQVRAVSTGKNLTLTNSSGSILNWQSFSIGAGNAVTFVQPNAQSQVLNRVVGNDPSAILGQLSSNGKVWLLNPNGVLFGQGARIDVGGLVASTLNLNDVDWLAGQSTGRFNLFGGSSSASIVNQGELRSSLGGHIALLGGSVRNEGLIESPNGQILLAAGKSIELIDTGSPNLRLRVTAPDGEALNLGTLQAAGGRIDVHGAVVNQLGIVRADSLGTNAAGEIVLTASQALNLGQGSITSASGATGGKISLDSGAQGTAMVSGEVQATGASGIGGNITVLGKNVGIIDSATLDASGSTGGGQIHVGGGERGQDANFRNSDGVYVGSGAGLAADATSHGNGGKIVLWGNVATRAYGSFSARGGPLGGNGGFIETSGHWIDVSPARLDATATSGLAGTWLLDPFNVTITDNPGSTGITTTAPATFTATANNATLSSAQIRASLNAGNNVIVSTGTGGTQAGDIAVTNANLLATPSAAVSLTLQAARDISVTRSNIGSTGTGAPVSVALQAAGGGFGSVSVTSSNITTRGGSISLQGSGYDSAAFSSGYGVSINSSSLNAGAASITIVGNSATSSTNSAHAGVLISSSPVTGQDIAVTGTSQNNATGTAYGVQISGASLTATHSLTLTGTSNGVGVSSDFGTALRVTPAAADPTATLSVTGTSTYANSGTAPSTNYGADITGQYGGSLQATNGATIDVTGNNLGGFASLSLRNNLPVNAASGGNATFRGNLTTSINAQIAVGGLLRVLSDDVTITSGSTLRSNAIGDALVVAGSGSPNTTTFVNQAGNTAFTTPNGRWLVYGKNTSEVVAGGLGYAFKQYNARFGEPNALTPSTGNGLLYSEAPVVTINGSNFSKTYDGTTAAGPLASAGLSFTGLRDADAASAAPGGTGTFVDKDAGMNKVVTVSGTALNIVDDTGIPVLGYVLTSNLRGDILRKNITLGTVSASNKVYDGTTTASVTVGSLNGLVGSETLVTSASGNFDTKDAGTGKTVTVAATVANGANGGLASNYLLNPSATSTTASITPRNVTFSSVTAQDKVYDGNRVATVSAGPLVGLVGSETLTTSLSGLFDTKDVGANKLVSVSVTAGNGSNGGLLGNYTVPTSASARAAITPAALTLRANDASKTYGTTLTFTGSEFTPSGLVTGESVGSVTLSSSGAPASASVAGGPYPIVASNAIGGSFSASNYAIAYVNGSLTVTRADLKAVVVGIVGNPTKTYDGTDVATLTSSNYSLSGFVGSDSATVSQTTGRYDSPNAGARTVTTTLTSANYAPVGSTDLNNYSLPNTASGAGTITPKTLALTGLAANNKVYDGNVAATLSNTGALAGLVGGQTLTLSNTGASFNSKDAGTAKTVTIGGIVLGNGTGLASNYQLATTASTTADITPKTLTVNGITAVNKVYDGSRAASVTLGALSGLVGSETLGTSGSGTFDTKDVGTSKTVTVGTVLSDGSNGGLASNYRLVPSATTTADITPKTLTLASLNAANKVYDGNTAASVTIGGLTGLVGSETLSTNSSGTFDTKDAGTAKTVTVATSLFNGSNGGLASNYRLVPSATTTADITPKTLTFASLNAANKVYDGNTAAIVAIGGLVGLVGSETLGTSSSGSFDTKDAGTAKTVTVATSLSDGSNGGLARNYRLTSVATTVADITPKTLTAPGVQTTIAVTAANKVYDGNSTASILVGSLSGLVGAETLVFSASGNFDTKDVGTAKPVTVTTSLANGTNGGLASNYLLAPLAPTTADITPRTLTIGAATAADKVYDGNSVASVSLGTVGNLVGNEALVTAASGSFDSKDVGSNKVVAIVVSVGNGANGGLASNYQLPTPAPSARAAIRPATLTYTANPASKVVGSPLPALSGSVSGFVGGETLAGATTGSLGFVTPALTSSPAGRYAVNGTGLSATNYAFVQATDNATALTVTGSELQPTDQGSTAALSRSIAVVAPTPGYSSPSDGRVLDILQSLSGSFLAQGPLFSTIPVSTLSQDQLTALLTARDHYKKSLFAEALRKLEQNPGLADAPSCPSTKEVDNGTCLITPDLKKQLQAEQARVQIATGPTPTPPAATAPAPVPENIPAPGGSPAPATAAIPATPSPARPPAVAVAPPSVALPILLRRRVRSASLPQIERKIALVIGIDRYNDKAIPQLDNSVNDARSIGQLLESTLGYDTVVLPNASKAAVIRALNRLAIEAGPNDSVVVYYAGHGDVVPATGLGYWQLTDSDAKKPETWLSNADITRLIAQIGASQVALISDSCYSGSLVDERIRGVAGTVDPQSLLTSKSVVVMSSGGNEPVFDSGKQGHSPFAYSLMNNLQQVATWQAGGNVFERVRFAVARELPQRPRYGTAASAGHQAGGDYLFEQRKLDVTP